MAEFQNNGFGKLKPAPTFALEPMVAPVLIDGETIIGVFEGLRDGVVFTNKRIIALNMQQQTGTKKEYTFIPYSKIQLYSMETAGTSELENTLVLWLSGVGKMTFAFSAETDLLELCRILSVFVL